MEFPRSADEYFHQAEIRSNNAKRVPATAGTLFALLLVMLKCLIFCLFYKIIDKKHLSLFYQLIIRLLLPIL